MDPISDPGRGRTLRAASKPAVAAIVIGVSVWCAAGTLSVLVGDATSPRLIVAAPWWVALIAGGLALCVPGWRARPMTTVPALLTVLPWLPIPLPGVALIWTGPLAWLPIGAALLVAEGSRALVWRSALEPRRGLALAATGSMLIALCSGWALDPRVPGGDEPHYLVITQSLLNDADLQIENNHDARDYAAYFGGSIAPDYLVRGQNGAIYSIHAPGVSALVLPGFAVAGLRGAQITLLLLCGLTGALIWSAAYRLTHVETAAWFAWASIAGSTTMAVLSVMVFPDAPGACAVAAGVWLLVAARTATVRSIVAVSLALAALPWLHTRFAVLAGLLGLAVAGILLSDSARSIAVRWRRVGAFVAVPLVSALGWFAFFYLIYGTVDPRVPYGTNPELRSWIWGAVVGLFADQQFGLFTYAPVLATAFVGLVIAAPRAWRTPAALCIGMLLVYSMAVASYWMWWAGVPGIPARFLTAALPLLAVPLSVVWAQSKPLGRTWLLALLAMSMTTTALVLGVDRGAMAWNGRTGQSAWLEWLSPVVNLPRVWPSFFWRDEGAFLWHVGIVAAVVVAVWGLVGVIAHRQTGTPHGRRSAVAGGVLIGAMLMAGVGWSVTDSTVLDPARAQLAVHGAAGQGRAAVLVGPGVGLWNVTERPLRIRSDQAPLVDRPTTSILTLPRVPAGAYRVRLTPRPARDVMSDEGISNEVTPSEIIVRLGRSPRPLANLTLAPNTAHEFPLVLPAGAAVLLIEAHTAELAGQWDATLVPESLARPGSAMARSVWESPAEIQTFFLDDHVFPEAEGFWVRGSRTAEVVLSGGAAFAGRTRVMQVRNGGVDNVVTITSGQWREVVTLEAWQEHVVTLPPADVMGSWSLAVTSASGFQPAVLSGGDDTRFLGVWIQ